MAQFAFDTIKHKFFIFGHSYSASDKDFATIEKRANRCKLCNVDDVKRAICSFRLDRQFKVIDMGKKTFLILSRLHFWKHLSWELARLPG